jgi:hypothetical protein
MKVQLVREYSGFSLKAKSEVIFFAGFDSDYCEIYTTRVDKNCRAISTHEVEEKESNFGIGVTIRSSERIADIIENENIQ